MRKATKSKHPKGAKRNDKRWFVSATGWGFALTLGSGSEQAVGTKTKRSFIGSDDSKVISNTFQIAPTYQDIYAANALAGITQGTTTTNRIGDRVFIENLSIRLLFNSVGAAFPLSGTTWRVMLVGTSIASSAVNLATGVLARTALFIAPGGNDAVNVLDPRLVHVLCDEVVTIQSTNGTGTAQAYKEIDCTVKSWYEYQPGTAVGVAANLYWIVLADQFGGTAGVTVGGTAYGNTLAVFSDADT
jgi:hypothetical protein